MGRKILLVSCVLLSIVSLATLTAEAKILFQKDSLYSHIRVEDTGGIRTLWFNNAPQTTMQITQPYAGAFEYTEFFHASHAFKPGLKKVLVLGLGGGSIPKAFVARYPDVSVTCVEIDPVVLDVARNYFYLPDSERLQVVIDDARRYLARTSTNFDAIFIDAYLADYYGAYVPFHLATKEFFELVAKRLTSGGVVAYNVTAQINGWNSASLNAIAKTMGSVFGELYIFPARTSSNVVLTGVKGGLIPSEQALRENATSVDRAYGKLPVSILSVLSRGYPARLQVANAPLLTDNYAPVEMLALFR